MQTNKFLDVPPQAQDNAQYGNATVKDLTLHPATTVTQDATIEDCIATLTKGGFDQVPVVDDKGGLVGIVTIGDLLAKIARGQVKKSDAVKVAMFHFDKTHPYQEVTPDTKL